MATATITINDEVKTSAQKKVKENNIRGGLSGYIENLISEDLKKGGKK